MKTHSRRWVLSLLVLTLGCSGGESDSGTGLGTESASEQSPASPDPIQVFLMAGQSNMVGYGPLTDADTGDWPESLSLDAMIREGTASAELLQTR